MTLFDIPVSDLRLYDVGSRVVLTSGGVTVDGILTNMSAAWTPRSSFSEDSEHKMECTLTVKDGTQESLVTNRYGVASVNLPGLPMDYRIQIERAITKVSPTLVVESTESAQAALDKLTTEEIDHE